MGATPTTKKLGPDQARLRKLMRRLAEASATDDASVEFVRDHVGLAASGGVGASLRFRI